MNHLQFTQSVIRIVSLTIATSKCCEKQAERGTAASPYPELVLTVLWSLVERPVIVETADIVYAVEALDPLWHTLQLRHIRDV